MKAKMTVHKSSFNKKMKDAGEIGGKNRDAKTDEHARSPHAIQ